MLGEVEAGIAEDQRFWKQKKCSCGSWSREMYSVGSENGGVGRVLKMATMLKMATVFCDSQCVSSLK